MAVTGGKKEGGGFTTSPDEIYHASAGDNAKGILGGQYMWRDLNGAGSPYQIDYSGATLNQGTLGSFDQMGAGAQGRQIDPTVYGMLLAQAQGGAGSAAHALLQQGIQRSQAAAMSMAASNPNVSPALAMRMAQNAQSDMATQGRQEGLQLQAQGQQALAGYTLQQQALNDAMTQFYMQQGFSRAEAEMKARADIDKANLEAATQNKGGLIGAVGSLVGLASSKSK